MTGATAETAEELRAENEERLKSEFGIQTIHHPQGDHR